MNKLSVIVVLVLMVVFTSCNKAAIDYNPNFNGYWKSEIVISELTGLENQSYLVLGETHNECGLGCQPSCLGCDCLQFTDGRALVNSNRTKLRIGPQGNTVTLTINQEPYLNSDSVWVCELNGLEFFKQ